MIIGVCICIVKHCKKVFFFTGLLETFVKPGGGQHRQCSPDKEQQHSYSKLYHFVRLRNMFISSSDVGTRCCGEGLLANLMDYFQL